MMKIYEILLFTFLFFLISAGVYILFINIGITNTNLDEKSKQDLVNLEIYQSTSNNPFLDENNQATSVNYSLTAYSTTGEFEQSNIETKGALESILDILGNNSINVLKSPMTLFFNFSPLPKVAFDWVTNMLLAFIGIVVFISGLVAWKTGVWSNK